MLALIDYTRDGYVRSNLPSWIGTIRNILSVSPKEIIYTDQNRESSKYVILLREQKPDHRLYTLVENFKNLEYTFLDQFAGSYSTARAWIRIPLHRRFFVSNNDPTCNKHRLQAQALIEVFA